MIDGYNPGGWSGIDVTRDGQRFTAVSDNGHLTTGVLHRSNDRRLTHATGVSAPDILQYESDWHAHDSQFWDAEGIDIAADGTMTLSYEGVERVARHKAWNTRALWIPFDPQSDNPENAGLEAVAVAPDGSILTIAEAPVDDRTGFRIARFRDGAWTTAGLLARDVGWRPVGADFADDGQLYVLERRFLGFGFASRIRSIDLINDHPPYRGSVVYRSPPSRHGNLEGIGMWRDRDGHLRATMITDDNHNRFQRGELVEVILPDPTL